MVKMSKLSKHVALLASVVIVALQQRIVSAEWGVAPECSFFVQMGFLQDFSDSSRDDRVVIGAQLVSLLDNMDATFPNEHSFATFVDKPIQPLGYPYQGPWFEGDWCYRLSNDFTYAGSNEDSVDQLISEGPGGGSDYPENQLGAMLDFVKGPTAMWNTSPALPDGTPVKRVLVVSTDSIYHIAGDGQEINPGMVPNDGDGETDCTGEDYPTVAQVKSALMDKDVYVVFLIGDSSADGVFEAYEELLNTLGTPGAVYSVNADGSNVLDIMEVAFEALEDEVCSETVDVVFSQDVTYSYNNDLTNFQNGMSSFITKVDSFFYKPRFGLTSFGDKPLPPLGHGPSGDYCFKVGQSLTEDSASVEAAAQSLELVSGFDWRESQLDAMISSVATPGMGWRLGNTSEGYNLVRIVLLGTDAGYHRTGDAEANGHALAPHPGIAIDDASCTQWEYPSVAQLAAALTALDVHPVFVPTSDIAFIYKNLVQELEDTYGVVGDVVELKDFDAWPVPTANTVKALSKKVHKMRRLAARDVQA